MEDYKEIFEEFKRQRPTLVKKVDTWVPGSDEFEIIVLYKDGSKDVYDSLLKTTRYIPPRSDDEEIIYDIDKWKREFRTRLHRTIFMKGIPQWKLSELSGVSEVMISKYINGEAIPSAYVLYRLAKALGCSVEKLSNFENV